MFDIIKNNKGIFGIIGIGIFLVLIIFIVMFTVGSRNEVVQDDAALLPDTSAERDLSQAERDAIFGPTDAKRWVSDENEGRVAPDFRALTKDPVAKAVIFNRFESGASSPSVRFVTLGDGFIYETTAATVSGQEKLSDKLINNIGDVVWSRKGTEVLMRNYSSSLESVNATLGTFMQGSSTEDTSTFSEYQTTFEHRQLENGLRGAAFSPDGSQIFYLVEIDGGTLGFIESVQTGTRANVWRSVFKNLTVSWTSNDNIIIYNNPSSHLEGVVWILKPGTGSKRVMLANELALSGKLNPDGNKLLYSLQEEESGAFSLRVLDLDEGAFRVLPMDTMTEKCSWGPSGSANVYCAVPRESVGGSFLEDWYMGVDYTDDVIWRVDVNSGNAKMLLDPRETTGEEFDIVDLQTDPHEGFLIFKTRVNNALWSLKLPQEEITAPENDAAEVPEE